MRWLTDELLVACLIWLAALMSIFSRSILRRRSLMVASSLALIVGARDAVDCGCLWLVMMSAMRCCCCCCRCGCCYQSRLAVPCMHSRRLHAVISASSGFGDDDATRDGLYVCLSTEAEAEADPRLNRTRLADRVFLRFVFVIRLTPAGGWERNVFVERVW